MIQPHEKWKQYRPRKGDPIAYQGQIMGNVTNVEGELCYWTETGRKDRDSFIWCFGDGLNALHDWPTKGDGPDARYGSDKPARINWNRERADT